MRVLSRAMLNRPVVDQCPLRHLQASEPHDSDLQYDDLSTAMGGSDGFVMASDG